MMELIERFEVFTTTITKTYKCIQKIKMIESERIGLKANQVMYLHYLGKSQDGLTPIELANHCLEDKAAVSRAISILTSKGLIKISNPDSEKKYRAKLVLTEEGLFINERINTAINNAVNKASKDLSVYERDEFYSIFNKVANNLEDICISYAKEKF